MTADVRIAVITGATGGLGKTVTKLMLERGMKVVASFRSDNSLAELMEYIGPLKDNLTSVKADITVEKDVQSLFQKAMEMYGRIDVMVDLAGGYAGGNEGQDIQESEWDFMMSLNLKSAFLCAKSVLPIMLKQNHGKIVFVAARPAVEGRYRAKSAAYAVSKAGVVVLAETISEEVKKSYINVNVILPSTIDTPENRKNIPQGDFVKWVKPEEIGNVILFLISDDSTVTNGAVIPVYGKA